MNGRLKQPWYIALAVVILASLVVLIGLRAWGQSSGGSIPPVCLDPGEEGEVLTCTSGAVVFEPAGGGGGGSSAIDDEWRAYSQFFFFEDLKLEITGGATNTFTLSETVFDDGMLSLNIDGVIVEMTSPATLDLSTVEGGGNPVDDGLPFIYDYIWVDPSACNLLAPVLDCAVLGGTLNEVTAAEFTGDALLAREVAVQTPATVNTEGPASITLVAHELAGAASNTQNAASNFLSTRNETAIAVTGEGTALLNVNEVLWSTARGVMVTPAFPMASSPYYVLGALADAAGQEPLDVVNSMADVTELSDGTAIPANDYFYVTLRVGIYEKVVSYSRMFLALPSCSYAQNRLNDALLDSDGCATGQAPTGFSESVPVALVLTKNDTNLIETIELIFAAIGGFSSEGTVRGPPVVIDGNVVIFDGPSGQFIDQPPSVPSVGQVPTWNVGGFTDWETPSGGGEAFCTPKLVPATDEEFFTVWRAPVAVTISEIYCEVTGGTSVLADLEIDDGTPAAVNGSDITCTTSGVADSALAGDVTMAAGDRLDIDLGTVTGAVTHFSICWTFTRD